MADDLIIKFFQQDLTEAEEKALGDILASSTEDAYRFYQHAEAAYRFCGLPEPHRAGGRFPRGFLPGGGMNLGLWLSFGLTAGLLAWATWHFMQDPKTSILALGFQSLAAAPISPQPPGPSIPDKLPEKIKPVISSLKRAPNPVPGPEKEGSAVRPLAESHPVPGPRSWLENTPLLTPVDAALASHNPHTNLEVLVHRRAPGQVKVQVLNAAGSPVLLLFQGMLQPGSWIFDWNGVLGNGEKASAGTYQIEVVSGRTSQRKKVVIRKK